LADSAATAAAAAALLATCPAAAHACCCVVAAALLLPLLPAAAAVPEASGWLPGGASAMTCPPPSAGSKHHGDTSQFLPHPETCCHASRAPTSTPVANNLLQLLTNAESPVVITVSAGACAGQLAVSVYVDSRIHTHRHPPPPHLPRCCRSSCRARPDAMLALRSPLRVRAARSCIIAATSRLHRHRSHTASP